jgi:hypothetical protein
MTWIDDLDPRQQQELDFARLYATSYAHGTDGHGRLMLIARLAHLLNQLEGDLQLAHLQALDDRPPLEQLVSAAQAAGSGGIWTLRGATGAVLLYTDAIPPDRTPEYPNWLALEPGPPHGIIVLIRIAKSDGGPDGVEFRT